MPKIIVVRAKRGRLVYETQDTSVVVEGATTLTFPAIEKATGYTVYTKSAMDLLEANRRLYKQLRRIFNRRKKQARARTGRR